MKPASALQRVLGFYAPPGEKVLVLRAGSGAEVRAAILAGHSVVAVEEDPNEYMSLCAQMEAWDAAIGPPVVSSGKDEKEDGSQDGSVGRLAFGVCGGFCATQEELRGCVVCMEYACLKSCLPDTTIFKCSACLKADKE